MLNKQVEAIYREVKKINRFASFINKSEPEYPFISFFIDNYDVETSLKMLVVLEQKFGFEGVVCGTKIMGGVRKENWKEVK